MLNKESGPQGTLPLPDDDEIFAGASLVPGEDREAYKRLLYQVWKGVWPRDGYETFLVQRIVENQWMARRLTRLSRLNLAPSAESYLRFSLTMAQEEEHGEEPARKQAEQLVGDLGRNRVKAYSKVKALMARAGKDPDAGLLAALNEENALEVQNAIEAQIDHYCDRADHFMKQLLKRRERQAVLWVKECA